MSAMVTCWRCRGRGDVLDPDPERRALRMRVDCPACGGTGLLRPGKRLTPGPAPLWFKAAMACMVVFVGWLWFDHLVNWRWVLRWLFGASSVALMVGAIGCGGMEPETEEREYLRVEVWQRFFPGDQGPPKIVWEQSLAPRHGQPIDGTARGPSVVVVVRRQGQSLWTTALCHEYAHIWSYQKTNSDDRDHRRTELWTASGGQAGMVPTCEWFLKVQEQIPGGLPPGLMPTALP